VTRRGEEARGYADSHMGKAVRWYSIVRSCASEETLEVDELLRQKGYALVKFARGSKWGIVRHIGPKGLGSIRPAKEPTGGRLMARFPSFIRCKAYAAKL